MRMCKKTFEKSYSVGGYTDISFRLCWDICANVRSEMIYRFLSVKQIIVWCLTLSFMCCVSEFIFEKASPL